MNKIMFISLIVVTSLVSNRVEAAPEFTEQPVVGHYKFNTDIIGEIVINTQSGMTEKGVRTIVNWELNVPPQICPRLSTPTGELRAYFKDGYGNTIFNSNVGINRVGHISDPQTKKESMEDIVKVDATSTISCYSTEAQLQQAALEAEAAAAKARERAGAPNSSNGSLGKALNELFNLF